MTAKSKRIYLLPHNDTYSLIDSFHTGGIKGEGYIMCDNCRALINRVAVIQSAETNITSHVGFDCAKTLTSIKQQDIENHLSMFKIGESIRKSFLNYFKQTIVCKVSIIEKDGITYFSMDSNNNGRLWFNKELTINTAYRKYIEPQISNLSGIFIKRTRIPQSILDELINHIEVGMEINKNSYHQRITSIDIPNNNIILDDLYMRDNKSTSTRPILSVLGDLLHTDLFKESLLKINLNKLIIMLHARQDYMRIQDPENKIGEDEPVFLLRAKDLHGPYAVRCWAQVVNVTDNKLAETAYDWADRMEKWQENNSAKLPDMPMDESNITK